MKYLAIGNNAKTIKSDKGGEWLTAILLAVVFASDRPARFIGRPTLDGDANDLRFLDSPGHVVALTAKGRAKRDRTGFVVRNVA